jgi:hypothetical protein
MNKPEGKKNTICHYLAVSAAAAAAALKSKQK